MLITEEDIFKYVFFPGEIPKVKKEFIKDNEKLFAEQIDFCRSLLDTAGDEEIKDQIKKAADKILEKVKIIELYPVPNKKINKKNDLTLAAATTDIAYKQSESITYSDENSKYLVRVINNRDKYTLYFFSKEDDPGQKLKITLVPSLDTFHIRNSPQNIEIDKEQSIQKILIEQE